MRHSGSDVGFRADLVRFTLSFVLCDRVAFSSLLTQAVSKRLPIIRFDRLAGLEGWFSEIGDLSG
jgi:hypothetical protein